MRLKLDNLSFNIYWERSCFTFLLSPLSIFSNNNGFPKRLELDPLWIEIIA